MARGVSRRPDEAAGRSLNYETSLPAGLTILVTVLAIGALIALVSPALDALPTFVSTLTGGITGMYIAIGIRRRVTLTADGRLLITGFGQHVDVDAGRIIAVSVSRRGRLGFGSAVVHWDGGRFPIWQAMRYAPETSFWSWRSVTGHRGKDFGDLVYRLRAHNPTLVIEGVAPPAWALPPAPPQPPRWW